MKIIAEFNSVEELLNFTNTFGAKTFVPKVEEEVVVEALKKEVTVVTEQAEKKQSNQVQEDIQKAPVEDHEHKEENITFDMVKDICSKALKAQKSSDVKAIVAKYGAKKISDLKEENYKAIYEEVGGLL